MSASETPRKPRGRQFFANPGPTNIPDSVLRAMDRPDGRLQRPRFIESTSAASPG